MQILTVGVVSVLVASAVPAWSRCGDGPNDAAAVADVDRPDRGPVSLPL